MLLMASVMQFQSTPPVWGATSAMPQHLPSTRFQSTPPVWGATGIEPFVRLFVVLFQSTPPVWGATK